MVRGPAGQLAECRAKAFILLLLLLLLFTTWAIQGLGLMFTWDSDGVQYDAVKQTCEDWCLNSEWPNCFNAGEQLTVATSDDFSRRPTEVDNHSRSRRTGRWCRNNDSLQQCHFSCKHLYSFSFCYSYGKVWSFSSVIGLVVFVILIVIGLLVFLKTVLLLFFCYS